MATKARAFTIDSLNISLIEASKRLRDLDSEPEVSPPQTPTELATWAVTDILHSLGGKDKDDVRAVIAKSNELVELLLENEALKHQLAIETVVAKISFLLAHPVSQLRCCAYRILRHCVVNEDVLLYLVKRRILIFIIVTLSTSTPLLEKEEALKLVREFLAVPGGANFISLGVIKALVSLVEHENDELAENQELYDAKISPAYIRICVETLCEAAVLKPDVAFYGGGIRLLISLIISGSSDVASACLMTILTLLDLPDSRVYLRNGYDLDSLALVFSQFEDDDSGRAPNLKKYYNRALKISFLFTILMKTWPGLISLSHGDFLLLRAVLANLKKRNDRLRHVILDMLLDSLRVKTLPWLEKSLIGDIVAASTHTGASSQPTSFEYSELRSGSFEESVVAHYQGLLCKVLLHCKILPSLFDLITENKTEEVTSKATFLLTRILTLCRKFLPPEFYKEYIFVGSQPLPVSAFDNCVHVLSLDRSKRAENIREVVRDLTIENRMHVDDTAFKNMISKSKVLVLKEYQDWQWSYIAQLFQGPLRNRKRFLEVQEKFPKFLKSIFSFYRPFKYKFANVSLHPLSRSPQPRNPKKIIVIGCHIIELLLTFDEGSNYLITNKLMPQLAEIFAQVDPDSGITADEPILSKVRLENTLSIGYVKFIGSFSLSARGIQILDYWQFFPMFSNIISASCENDSYNHLLSNLFKNIDFTYESPFRVLLNQALAVGNPRLRVFLLTEVVSLLFDNPDFERFVVKILLPLLHEESVAVVEHTILLLYTHFIERNRLDSLDILIEHRPNTVILERSPRGRALLLNLCRSSAGFKFLLQDGFIERRFDECVKDLHGFEYLDAVERTIRHQFFPYFQQAEGLEIMPDLHHFFHYLLFTEEGFNFFSTKRKLLDELLERVRDTSPSLRFSAREGEPHSRSPHKAVDIENPFQDDEHSQLPGAPIFSSKCDEEEFRMKMLRQDLWILGEIGSAPYGLQMLDPIYMGDINTKHVVDTMLQLFTQSTSWKIRGLAFFQLGKLASTDEGVEFLDDLQWVSLGSASQKSIVLAYPRIMNEGKFFEVILANPYQEAAYFSLFSSQDKKANSSSYSLDHEDEFVFKSYEELDDKILSLVGYLGSVLGRIERKAKKELLQIKADNPQAFESEDLLLQLIRLIDRGNFKFRARLFCFGLFNFGKVAEMLIKRDRKILSTRSHLLLYARNEHFNA